MFRGTRRFRTSKRISRSAEARYTAALRTTGPITTKLSRRAKRPWPTYWTSKPTAWSNASIARRDLDAEMTVVRNEFESGENSAFGVLRERMAASAYLWHNYGKAIIGARSDIENVPIERLRAFYRHYYSRTTRCC